MREKFQNRVEAGSVLAGEVARKYKNVNDDVIVLALPRWRTGGLPDCSTNQGSIGCLLGQENRCGGVCGKPFGYGRKGYCTQLLSRSFSVAAKWLPSYSYEELAMGAITETSRIFNEDIISMLHIDQKSIDRVIQREVRRQLPLFDNFWPTETMLANRRPNCEDVIKNTGRESRLPMLPTRSWFSSMANGIATGATMRAAYTSLKKLNPAKIIVAVPVAAPETLKKMGKEVDDIICPLVPRSLSGIGQWYHDFSQTEDDEVLALLARAEEICPVPTISAEDTEKYQSETILE
ncbi:15725_t:CDS:2 [Acaulospora morrowiae]|uniref:15725_t:CDS:1 n=1 Tax=Acaulospora morrowiae TaxID=94023 RepID=A0A9N9EWH1_9GLOM|nr:15725_t:CDS:2 [Acaulospora morrowiae]